MAKTKKSMAGRYAKSPYGPSGYIKKKKAVAVYRAPVARSGAGELKFFDTSLAFTFDITGEVPATGQLTLIPQGVTESTRVGRMCTVRSIYIRASVVDAPAAAAVAATSVVLYIVLDKQCNGAAAAVTDVLTSGDMWDAQMNLSNSNRFRILGKWTHNFNATAGVTTAYNSTRHLMEKYIACNIPIEFSGTDGTLGTIRSNNIFLLAGSAGGDDTCTVDGTCRLRFSD